MNDAARLLELREEVSAQWRPLLTKAAQALAVAGAADGDCRRCGAPVDQLPRGRPRRYCTTCSPRKSRKKAIWPP